MSDWHTHVFTSTYTSDVSGVCSVLYELGGMTILHDPSGCNSTYTTHDEPRWFDQDSLMYVSGLDELTAVLGDDSVIIQDVIKASKDLKPRFISLCGASIPHIIAFDYVGVAHLIEEATGIPVVPIPTDGLKSYVSGVGLASRNWIKRFADIGCITKPHTYNLLGVTPIDFVNQENVDTLEEVLNQDGYTCNCCFGMGSSFDELVKIYQGEVNIVGSSCGRLPARFMFGKKKIPYVEGLPIGHYMQNQMLTCMKKATSTNQNQTAYDLENDEGNILVIGEEIVSRSLATAMNHEQTKHHAYAMWPDVNEGFNEDILVEAINKADYVICDPLFDNCIHSKNTKRIALPHIGYSGRMFMTDIPILYGDLLNTFMEGIK